MSVQIEKIIIEIDGEKIKLTLDQARELQKILDDTLGARRNETVYHPIIIERPIRPWRWIEPWSTPYWTISTNNNVDDPAHIYSLTAE